MYDTLYKSQVWYSEGQVISVLHIGDKYAVQHHTNFAISFGHKDFFLTWSCLSSVSCLDSLLIKSLELTAYVFVWDRYHLVELPWDSAWTWWFTFLGVDLGYYWVHRFSHGTSYTHYSIMSTRELITSAVLFISIIIILLLLWKFYKMANS